MIHIEIIEYFDLIDVKLTYLNKFEKKINKYWFFDVQLTNEEKCKRFTATKPGTIQWYKFIKQCID